MRKIIGIPGVLISLLVLSKNVSAAQGCCAPEAVRVDDQKEVSYQLERNTEQKLDMPQDRVSVGQGTLEDFKALGITTVKEETLEDVNWYLKGKDNSTVSKINANVNAINSVLSNVNAGGASIANYNTIGITEVNANNLSIINKSIKEERTYQGKSFTIYEIKEIVHHTLNNIETSISNITNGKAMVSDFKTLGINTVKTGTLADVNWYLKGKNASTISIINTNINTILTALSNVNLGSASLANYNTLGITKVNANNLRVVNNAVKATKSIYATNLTRTEISSIVDKAIVNMEKSINNIASGQALLSDYKLLGINIVKEETLQDVNWYLEGKDASTIAIINTNVNTINNALLNANAATKNLAYYNTLGITSVNSNNISVVSNSIKAKKETKARNFTRKEISKIVDDAIADMEAVVNRITKGKATLNDFKLLGITSVKVETIEDVDWYLEGKDASTIAIINTNVNILNSAVANINAGTTNLTYYNTLQITKVNANNVTIVVNAIKKAKEEKGINLTREEIIKTVNKAISDMEQSIRNISTGKGTIYDYRLLGITSVNKENISDVEWYLDGKDASTLAAINANIKTILTALANVNAGTTNLAYYNTLGITNVNANNIKVVSNAIKSKRALRKGNFSAKEIGDIVDEAIDNMNKAIDNIILGKATLSDYSLLGITVRTETLADVNWYLKGKDASTISVIASNVNKINTAIANINAGSVNLAYYNILEITKLDANSAKIVSNAIKQAKVKKGSNLTRNEIIEVVNSTIK